jgi:hypothetical protein
VDLAALPEKRDCLVNVDVVESPRAVGALHGWS